MTTEGGAFETRSCFASDEDGCRHLIVDAEDADLAGWRLRTADRSGHVDDSAFSAAELRGEPGKLSFLGHGERRRAWVAVSEWGTTSAVAVDPDGAEHVVFGDEHAPRPVD